MAGERDRLPAETLTPLAAKVDAVLALYGYEMRPAINAIDAAVEGYGGVFAPQTTAEELHAATDAVLAAGAPSSPPPSVSSPPLTHDATGSRVVVYVDGSARGNPGPAGAGAVLQTGDTTVARLGRPVGSRTGNNTAEYAALQLGLDAVERRCDPASVEVRIDSMTVINSVWIEDEGRGEVKNESEGAAPPYTAAITEQLSAFPTHEWTHLADSDPNPADPRATVGADIAALGPG